MKKSSAFTRVLAVKWRVLLLGTLLLLGVLLLLSACSGSSNPGSQPNNPPSNGGYSLIHLVNQEIHFVLTATGR